MLARSLATLHRLPMTIRAGTRRSALRSRWWYTCIAWYALLALAWPSLGPLPYLVHDFGAHRHDARAQGTDDDHIDASSIPGSPTHPIDHDCPECEVLKHLARCILPTPGIAVLAPVFVGVVAQAIIVVRPCAWIALHLPPVRAPPAAAA